MERDPDQWRSMTVGGLKFDFTIPPVKVDWSGKSGPIIKLEDIKNSVMFRMIGNDYYPSGRREYIHVKPWWNPLDPYGKNITNRNNKKPDKFIPGCRHARGYPQLSSLTRQQHQQGVRVLSGRHRNVQPRNFFRPTQKDYLAFEAIKEVYELEQKEYLKWAKQLWLNGDCIRALRPKPALERIYDAEFRMRSQRVQSLPQNYAMAAQIPLETKSNDFVLEHTEDLIGVNIEELPLVNYPEEMDRDFSILMKSCPVPVPCGEHPCMFVMPSEDSVSVLPLTEINRELAQYAMENGCTFIASENALHCLLESERSWKLPVSVVELKCPDSGEMKVVIVVGSEFGVQKECATQRTYKAYKHLLEHCFAPSTGHYNIKSRPKQLGPDEVISSITVAENQIEQCSYSSLWLGDDLAVSSEGEDDDKLLIDDNGPNSEPKRDRCKPNKLKDCIDRGDLDEHNKPNNGLEEFDKSSSEPDEIMIDGTQVNERSRTNSHNSCIPSSESLESRPSYNLTHSDHNRQMIDDGNSEPTKEIYDVRPRNDEPYIKPVLRTDKLNYSNNAYYAMPGCSYKPNSEPDQLVIDEPSNDTSDSEPDNFIIDLSDNELSNTSKPFITSFETNKESFPINNESASKLLETYDEAPQKVNTKKNAVTDLFDPNKDVASSFFEAKKDTESFVANEVSGPSFFETNKVTDPGSYKLTNKDNANMLVEKNKNTALNLFEADKNPAAAAAKTSKVESNKQMTSDCRKPTEVSPINPCTIRVRNLSITKANEYNLTGLFSEPKIAVVSSNKPAMRSFSENSIDLTEALNNSNDNRHTRLGISGIIRKNRSSSGLTNVAKVNNLLKKSPSKQSKRTLTTENVIEPNTEKANQDTLESSLKSATKQSISVTNPKDVVVNESTASINSTRTSLELSPVKPCLVSVKKLNIGPYIRKLSFSGTNNEPTEKTNELEMPSKDICKANTPISPKTRTNTFDATEANVTPTTAETNKANHTKSPLKPCIKNNSGPSPLQNRSRKRCSFFSDSETEAAYKINYNDKEPILNVAEPTNQRVGLSNKRARKWSAQIELDHGCGQFTTENTRTTNEPRTRSISEIERDGCILDPNTNNKPNKATTTAAKSKRGKINMSELFGEESDSDVSICNTTHSKTNAKDDIIRTSLENETSDKLDCNSEKIPHKPCLAKISKTSKNSKRKISFSDPEFSISDLSDSEEAISGFHNGIAVLSASLTNKSMAKQKNVVTRTYGLRSRNKPKHAKIEKKIVKINKKSNGFTKVTPNSKKNSLQNVVEKIKESCASTDDSADSDSNLLKVKTKIMKQKTIEVGLRRSPRVTNLNVKENDSPHKINIKSTKTHVEHVSERTEGLRRSRRLSTRVSINENTEPKSDILKLEKKIPANSFTKVTKKDKTRRKSLPANMFSNTDKVNKIIRSNSLKNLNEIAYVKKATSCGRSRRRSTRPQTNTPQNTKQTLKLSQRTKRYLNRVFNSACSVTDESENEPEHTIKHTRSMNLTCSEIDSSAAEKRITRYSLRSNVSPGSKIANNSKSSSNGGRDNGGQASERTKLHMRRVNLSAYSSCDETNYIDSAAIKTNRVKPSKLRQGKKLKATNVSEKIERRYGSSISGLRQSSEPQVNENGIETIEIKLDLIEEFDDNINNETLHVLHFTERNETNVSDSDSDFTEDQMINSESSLDTTNDLEIIKTEVDNLNHVHAVRDAIKQIAIGDMKSYVAKETEQNQTQNLLECLKPDPDFVNTNSKHHNNTVRSRTSSFSDGSDYFDMDEAEVLNINHFKETIEADSEESEVEDPRTESSVVTARENYQTIEKHNIGDNTRDLVQNYSTVDETSNITSTLMTHTKVIDRQIVNTPKVPNNNKKDSPNLKTREVINDIIGAYNCNCKGTVFEVPPPRSYKKCRVKNSNSHVGFDVIVHSSHKVRKGAREVLLEPIVEYQPELGGTKQSAGKIRALALSLMLRQSAQLINVRVDHDNGNVIVIDRMSSDDFVERHGDRRGDVADILHTTVNQLRFLKPGQYVLAHDSCHGSNAMLYKSGVTPGAAQTLSLHAANVNMSDAQDALFAKIPPLLEPTLLPYHKHRCTLPLAFTPYPNQVREEQRASATLARARLPPLALQWPKRKKPRKRRQDRQAGTSHSEL